MKKWNLAALSLFGFIANSGYGANEIVLCSDEPMPAAVTHEEDFMSLGKLSQEHKEILLRSLWTGGMNEAKKRIVAMELGSLSKSDLETVLTECAALPLKNLESINRIIGKYIGND